MHKQEVEWFQHVQKNRWLMAYGVFLKGIRTFSGLKGMYEFAIHPSRRSVLEPAIARMMAVGPVHYDGENANWTLSQGVAFQLEAMLTVHHGLQRIVFERCAENLWKGGVQVWVDGTGSALHGLIELFRSRLNGTDTEFEAKPGAGPAALFNTQFVQTLWVCADSKGRDFDGLLGKPICSEWAEALKQRILDEFRVCIESTIDEYAVDADGLNEENSSLYFDRTLREDVIKSLGDSLVLTNPLDAYEGFKRHCLFSATHRTLLQVSHNTNERCGVVDLCPRPDGSLDGLSWNIVPAPTREALVEILWPIERRRGVLERMPLNIADPSWRPYLHSYQKYLWDLLIKKDKRFTASLTSSENRDVPVVALISIQECLSFQDIWHAKAREWLKPYLDEPFRGVTVRCHDVMGHGTVPTMTHDFVSFSMEMLLARIRNEADQVEEDPERAPIPNLVIIPEWHDGRTVSREQAAFGSAGMQMVKSVADWPEGIERTFHPGDSHRNENNDVIRGPAHMLRQGLGTWLHQAFSPEGQQLVYETLMANSPKAFEQTEFLGPVLDRISADDALKLGQLFGCTLLRNVWGYEFSWGVAFALGGVKHAAVEVRPALQERLDHTVVDDGVPGWTLHGPSEMTYVEFGHPIVVGTRKFHHRTVTRSVFGAYIWTKENFNQSEVSKTEGGDDATIDLSVAIVGVDEYEGLGTDIHPGGWSLKYFRSFRWQALDATVPINVMVQKLASRLEQDMEREDRTDSTFMTPEEIAEDAREDLRVEEQTFTKTMESLAKALLYMGLREARMEHENRVYGNNVGRGTHPLLKPKSKENKEKLKEVRDKESVLHKIRLGPIRFDDDVEESGAVGNGGGSKRPHYRVGHFRMQACGPGWRDRIRIWLKPQLIGSKSLVGGVPRLYDIG